MEIIWGNVLAVGLFALLVGRWVVAESKTIQKKIGEVMWRIEKLEEKLDSIRFAETDGVFAEAERELEDEET